MMASRIRESLTKEQHFLTKLWIIIFCFASRFRGVLSVDGMVSMVLLVYNQCIDTPIRHNR